MSPALPLTRFLYERFRTCVLPDPVLHEARRSWVNVVHTAVGAVEHDIVDAILRVHGRAEGAYSLPVRGDRVDAAGAALALGSAAHIEDFDDTHLATVIHPSAACFAAAFPAAQAQGASGRQALAAFALGIEAQLRLGVAITPPHYEEGWHITGTCGVVGAAVTAGLLSGLDAEQLAAAIHNAVQLTLGHREGFGSAVKPFHPGKAAVNGLLAVELARQGFDAGAASLDREGGVFGVFAPERDPGYLTEGLGERWELLANSYKPYPCGIVSHPAIDAAVFVAQKIGPLREIRSVRLHCHPLVVDLTGNPQPKNGLQAKFSTVHGVAAGLIAGTVGLPEYADDFVNREAAIELRAKTELLASDGIRRDEAVLEVVCADGETVREHVEHARGSLARPLTDDELNEKARGLALPVLGAEGAEALLAAAWRLDEFASIEQSFASCAR